MSRGRTGRGPRWLLALVFLRAALGSAMRTPQQVGRSFEVESDWRRSDPASGAVRLGVHQTIRPRSVTGRWRFVDPRLPFDGWRSAPKAGGVGLWAVVVAFFGWLGWSRGRGPLAELASYKHGGDGLAHGGDAFPVEVAGWVVPDWQQPWGPDDLAGDQVAAAERAEVR
jgi:hypothetical protein